MCAAQERSRRAILLPGVPGSGAPAAVAGYRELPKRAVAVSFPSVKPGICVIHVYVFNP